MITFPTVHLNGTSKQELIEQQRGVITALRGVLKALSAADPNGRDYYPQGNSAIQQAINEQNARAAVIQNLIHDHEAIVAYLYDQGGR